MLTTSQTQVDIFISYAHEDRPTAEALAQLLRVKGWVVWWDPSIRTGKRFSQVIEEALQGARCVFVMWSSHSIASDWVLDEAEVGKDRGVLFPVRIDAIQPPLGFRRIQTADLSEWNKREEAPAFTDLCDHLSEMLGDPQSRGLEAMRVLAEQPSSEVSRWRELATPPSDPTATPWPYWMIRYVVADNPEALSDLVWSVGASPPYGDVGYEEAEAVYVLIENFKGPGRAPEKYYADVERFIVDRPTAWRALEAFRIFDRVASEPTKFTTADLRIGGVDAVEPSDEPLSAYFNLLRAQLQFRVGDYRSARLLTLRGVAILRAFAQHDPVYTDRLKQALNNAAAACAIEGDFREARDHARLLNALGEPKLLGHWADYLNASPSFSENYKELREAGSSYLEANQPLAALEWLLAAERTLGKEGRETELVEILGDVAMAFQRLGNLQSAIRTYRRAIDLGQRLGDMRNVSRWCQNLASLLLAQDDVEAAMPYLRAGIYSAVRSRDLQQLDLAGHLLRLIVASRPQLSSDVIEVLNAAAKPLFSHRLSAHETPSGVVDGHVLELARELEMIAGAANDMPATTVSEPGAHRSRSG